MNNDEYAAIVRSMIEHENTLINQRMTWMWTLQGLLVAAVGIMWDIHYLLIFLICAFGFFSCVSVGISLKSALRAIDSLLKDANTRLSEGGYDGPRVIGSPGIRPVISKFQPGNLLPWLMMIVWVLLASAKIFLTG